MSTIAASELILNADGSIYHLGLHPDQIGRIIITVGDPLRVERVSRHFDRIEHQVSKREFVTHTGWLGAHRISVLSTGIGTDNLDIVMNELDALANIDLEARQKKDKHTRLDLIRVGTTGGLQAELPTGSFVSSAYAAGLDNLLHFYRYEPPAECLELQQALVNCGAKLPVLPYVVSSSPDLLHTLTKNWTHGITLTSPGFYAPQGRVLRLPTRLSDDLFDQLAEVDFRGLHLTNFEMETAGLMGLAHLMGHRAISCSVILANRPRGTFSEDPKEDTDRLIERVLEDISERYSG